MAAKVDKLKIFLATLDQDVAEMWHNRGAKFTASIAEADLVQFSGWGEVHPHYYKQKQLPGSSPIKDKDLREILIFQAAKKLNKHIAGIGRGAIFCHAAEGGGVYQHTDGHGPRVKHMVTDIFDSTSWMAPSSHSQLLMMHEDVTPVCVADISHFRDLALPNGEKKRMIKGLGQYDKGDQEDLEVALWWNRNTLCFTPLPFIPGEVETENKYLEHVTEYLLHNLGS